MAGPLNRPGVPGDRAYVECDWRGRSTTLRRRDAVDLGSGAARSARTTTAAATTVGNVGLCFRISRHHGCCGGMGELIVIVSAQVRARVKIIIIAELNY